MSARPAAGDGEDRRELGGQAHARHVPGHGAEQSGRGLGGDARGCVDLTAADLDEGLPHQWQQLGRVQGAVRLDPVQQQGRHEFPLWWSGA